MKKSSRFNQILLRQMERKIVASSRRKKFARVRPGSQLLQHRSILLPPHQ
jgi:hypothetical protein